MEESEDIRPLVLTWLASGPLDDRIKRGSCIARPLQVVQMAACERLTEKLQPPPYLREGHRTQPECQEQKAPPSRECMPLVPLDIHPKRAAIRKSRSSRRKEYTGTPDEAME